MSRKVEVVGWWDESEGRFEVSGDERGVVGFKESIRLQGRRRLAWPIVQSRTMVWANSANMNRKTQLTFVGHNFPVLRRHHLPHCVLLFAGFAFHGVAWSTGAEAAEDVG